MHKYPLTGCKDKTASRRVVQPWWVIMHSSLQPGDQVKAACVCVCMDVCEKKICKLICTGMSDDWMIYSSGLYEKWTFKQKQYMTTCCVYAMCMIVSGLYNTVYFCLRWKYKERKHVDRYLYCSCASLRECEVWRDAVALWVTVSVTVCNGKCRWCDVKGSRDLPVGHLKSNEVSTGHRLWRSTLLSNPPACHPESKKKRNKEIQNPQKHIQKSPQN